MSTQSLPTVNATRGAAAGDAGIAMSGPAAVPSPRATLVAVATSLGSVLVAATLLWHPWPPRDHITYAEFAPVRDAAWLGSVLNVVGHSAAAIGLAIAVVLLVPSRGARWANVGAAFTALGGVLFGAGALAYITVAWYGTSPALDAASGTALFDYLKGNLGHILIPQAIGLALFSLGSILVAVALWRARAVPRWVAIAVALLAILQFAVPTAAMDVVQSVRMLSFVAVVWFLVRPLRPSLNAS